MTDQEMMELAALAAGYVVESYAASGALWVYPKGAPLDSEGEPPIFRWNPKDDDGDALRLAVDLGLVIDCSRPSAGEPFAQHHAAQADYTDARAATRRAVLRAAAEVGKRMRENKA